METNPQQVQARAREVVDNLGPQIEQARQNLTDLNTRVVTFVRQNPGTCLIGALAFGFLVGKIASRR